jgi:hypothetical protein
VDRVVLNAIWGGSAAKMVVFDIVFAAFFSGSKDAGHLKLGAIVRGI